jgi:hypothetical protein
VNLWAAIELMVALWVLLFLVGCWALGYYVLAAPKRAVRMVARWWHESNAELSLGDRMVTTATTPSTVVGSWPKGRRAMQGEVHDL